MNSLNSCDQFVCLSDMVFTLTSPSASNQTILLPSSQKCRFCFSNASLMPCLNAFLVQFLHYHPWPWSSHTFPSISNYLTNAPLELAIKQHGEQHWLPDVFTEVTSIPFAPSLPASTSSPICWISTTCPLGSSLFQAGPGLFHSITKSYTCTWR